VPQIPANHVLVKNIDIMGFVWGSYRKRRSDLLTPAFAQLTGWYAEGRVRPVISHRLRLADAADGYRLLRERRATGKIVLETRN
jgi:NADPH2:quinone reductase